MKIVSAAWLEDYDFCLSMQIYFLVGAGDYRPKDMGDYYEYRRREIKILARDSREELPHDVELQIHWCLSVETTCQLLEEIWGGRDDPEALEALESLENLESNIESTWIPSKRAAN